MPSLFCCPPPPPPPGARAITVGFYNEVYGFAGLHLTGENWQLYGAVAVTQSLNGLYLNGNVPITGTRLLQAIMNDRYDSYTSSVLSTDADWDRWFPLTSLNMSSDPVQTRINATSWTCQEHWFNNFVTSGEMTSRYELQNPVPIANLFHDFVGKLDAFPLPLDPVERTENRYIYYPGSDELIDTFGSDYFIPLDGALCSISSPFHTAGPTLQDFPFNGAYNHLNHAPGFAPLALGVHLLAARSRAWNRSLMCQQSALAEGFPIVNAIESCGLFGGTADQNADGIEIPRPEITPAEAVLIIGGRQFITRTRYTFYQDPQFMGGLGIVVPACCNNFEP